MRIKRFTAALLAACLAFSLALPISAAGVPPQDEVAQVIGALEIMVGDENGNLNLDKTVTRAEFITMAIKASPQKDQVGQASTSPYPDVPRKHWASGYVEAGVRAGLISGYLDGTFRPSNTITLAEGATIVLKLLGYTSSDFSGAYPTAQMSLYRSLKLDQGLNAQSANDVLDRRDAMYLFYNLLSTKTTSGQYYMNLLGYSLNAAGEVDRLALLSQVMEGPVVASGNWYSQLPFDVSSAQITRAGKSAQLSDIQSTDLVYWNAGMRRLWVYTDKITGTIQAISPSAANPTSITLAGRTFSIETDAVTYALSDLEGGYGLGDTVTLLLGRGGGAAAILEPVAGADSKVGIVTALTKSSYSSGANGNSYTADTVTLLATDGGTYSYPWSTEHFEVGDLVEAVTVEDGTISLNRLTNSKLSGRISADATMLGDYPLADDVEILDTYGDTTAITVFPSRLAGVRLQGDMVRYYTLNAQGEVDRLILKETTGDMHQYGVVSDLVDLTFGMNVLVYYTLEINGQTTLFTSQGTSYPVDKGPFVLKGSLSAPDKLYQLKSAYVDRIDGSTVISDGRSFTLFDTVQVYEYRDGEYYLSNLDRIREGSYSLTAWYDKLPSEGGCVRVLVARAN